MAPGILSAFPDGVLKPAGAGFGIAAAENGDEVLASVGLRHKSPSLAGLGVAAECSLHQRRRVEFGFHGFHQIFSGVMRRTSSNSGKPTSIRPSRPRTTPVQTPPEILRLLGWRVDSGSTVKSAKSKKKRCAAPSHP